MNKVNLNKVQAARLGGFLILALLLAVAYVLILNPRLGTASNIRNDVANAQAANAQSQLQIDALKQSADELDKSVPIANRIAALFPPDADQKVLFKQIKDAGASVGINDLDIKSVQPGAPAFGLVDGAGGVAATPAAAGKESGGAASVSSANSIASQTLTITAEADIAKALQFINALENLDRSLLISTINISQGGDGQGASTLTVTGMMFMLPKPVNPKEPKTELPTDVPDIPGQVAQAEDPNATEAEKDLSSGLVKVKPKSNATAP